MTEVQKKAELFAREAHEGQFRKRGANELYVVHLEDVLELIKKYGGLRNTNWSYERRTDYIRWAYEVVSTLPHKPESYELG